MAKLSFAFITRTKDRCLPPETQLCASSKLGVRCMGTLLRGRACQSVTSARRCIVFPTCVDKYHSVGEGLFISKGTARELILARYESRVALEIVYMLSVLIRGLRCLLTRRTRRRSPSESVRRVFIEVLSSEATSCVRIDERLDRLK